jgi:hypothetical protein
MKGALRLLLGDDCLPAFLIYDNGHWTLLLVVFFCGLAQWIRKIGQLSRAPLPRDTELEFHRWVFNFRKFSTCDTHKRCRLTHQNWPEFKF